MKTYRVLTYDIDEDEYTPQSGLSLPWCGLTLWRLKQALRELRGMGYQCHRRRAEDGSHFDNDRWVLVQREE